LKSKFQQRTKYKKTQDVFKINEKSYLKKRNKITKPNIQLNQMWNDEIEKHEFKKEKKTTNKLG